MMTKGGLLAHEDALLDPQEKKCGVCMLKGMLCHVEGHGCGEEAVGARERCAGGGG